MGGGGNHEAGGGADSAGGRAVTLSYGITGSEAARLFIGKKRRSEVSHDQELAGLQKKALMGRYTLFGL